MKNADRGRVWGCAGAYLGTIMLLHGITVITFVLQWQNGHFVTVIRNVTTRLACVSEQTAPDDHRSMPSSVQVRRGFLHSAYC